MKIDREQLARVTGGAVSVEEDGGAYTFLRMTRKEAAVYESIPPYFLKTFSASSIRQDFITDAAALTFDYLAQRVAGVEACYFDVYINGTLQYTFGDDKAEGTAEGTIHVPLPQGRNRVTVYLPSLHQITIKNMELDGASYLEPFRFKRNMVCYGDSITQGFIAKHPSLVYVNRLAAALDAEVVNKGVGGATFDEGLLDGRWDAEPDMVTVAYGTNDWNTLTLPVFEQKSRAFLEKASAVYPGSRIFVFTPLWRSDLERSTKFGDFWQVGESLQKSCKGLPNVAVLDGAKLLPHSESFMADKVVHPDDAGHILMAQNALQYMR